MNESIPLRTRTALMRYIDGHMPTGSFLRAVLCNDLTWAVLHADEENFSSLLHIVRWLHNEAPSAAWGSREAYISWISADSKSPTGGG